MAASARVVSSRSLPKKQPVVIDLGSAFIRCGFAGEPRPIHVIPFSFCGNSGGDDGGDDNSGSASLRGAYGGVGSGGVGLARTREEWVEILTGVLSRLYTESLQCRPRERKVVVCESMVSPRPFREAVAHVLFRFLQVPSLHMCAGPAPALFCTGLDTGMVLDVGHSEAHVVAIYKGANIMSSYAGAPLGFLAVQERVEELLAEEEQAAGGGERGRPLASRELEDVVVRSCLVPVGGVPSGGQVSPMEFMFAGRRRVVASGTIRATAAQQALFEGDEEGRTLATLVLDCLKRCPRDCRRALVQNVVVAGGGALLPGLCARLAEEIEALTTVQHPGPGATPDTAARAVGNPERYAWAHGAVSGEQRGDQGDGGGGLCVVRVPVRRDQLVWTGASIMASLEGISRRSLTIEQYLEQGEDGGGEAVEEGGGGSGESVEGRVPDWMSVSSADWLFETAAPVAAM